MKHAITGAHVIIGSTDADADRAFFRDVLGLAWVDAGGGWPIFALPPAEVAVHPGKDGRHELYLMCQDLDATLTELKKKGAKMKMNPMDQPWGRIASFVLPGGSEVAIYQPKHASPHR
jgi:predicted enzyme related to lactoylglutathione lyase